MSAKENAPRARTTEAVAKQDHRFGRGVRREINSQWQITVARRVVKRDIHLGGREGLVQCQRIVARRADGQREMVCQPEAEDYCRLEFHVRVDAG